MNMCVYVNTKYMSMFTVYGRATVHTDFDFYMFFSVVFVSRKKKPTIAFLYRHSFVFNQLINLDSTIDIHIFKIKIFCNLIS